MDTKTILQINSSGRYQGSITRKLSNRLVQQLELRSAEFSVVRRDVATGLPFVNEQWIGANFTPEEERDQQHKEALSFSDELVQELKNETIVIASPIYNFSIPAVLKAWIDLVARAGLTFYYTDKGPVGLLTGKKVYLVTSGGVPIGSEMDLASRYMKQVLGFIGLTDVSVIDAAQFDLESEDLNLLEE